MVRNKQQIIERDWEETDPHVRGIRTRRKHARFEASLHVTYEVGGRRAVAFSQNISQGGMLLRQAPGLYAGSEVDFVVTLNDGEMPMAVRGEVLAVNQHGVRVCFATNQPAAATRLANYVRMQVVPALEAEMSRPISSLQHVVELASLYADQGRYNDAVALYRAQLGKRARQIALYENMCRLMSNHLTVVGHGTEAELTELSNLVAVGLALGKSAVLEHARQLVERLRQQPQHEPAPVPWTTPDTGTAVHRPVQRPPVVAPSAGNLEARDARVVAENEELRAWQESLEARAQALTVREASLRTADAELNGRTAALERGHTAHVQRMSILEAREATLSRDTSALAARSAEVAERTSQMVARHAQLEERERAVTILRAQMETRELDLLSREDAVDRAAAQLRQQQGALATRHEDVAKQLEQLQNSYELNVQGWMQRVRQFSAEMRVRLTAKQKEFAALNESLKAAQAALTGREQRVVAAQRQLVAEKNELVARESALNTPPAEGVVQARLAQLNQMLKEAESDLLQRDQAIVMLKQTLAETRATLDAKNKLLATLSQARVVGTTDVNGPARLDNAGFDDAPTGLDLHRQTRRLRGDVEVIGTEDLVEDEGGESVNGTLGTTAEFKWRLR